MNLAIVLVQIVIQILLLIAQISFYAADRSVAGHICWGLNILTWIAGTLLGAAVVAAT
jgi:hypothetical protein